MCISFLNEPLLGFSGLVLIVSVRNCVKHSVFPLNYNIFIYFLHMKFLLQEYNQFMPLFTKALKIPQMLLQSLWYLNF
jgi:hypothetical protein